MNETMLAVLGFASVLLVVALLLKKFTTPPLAFVAVATLTAIVLVSTGTFTLKEISSFINAGVRSQVGTASLFIFSVIFFGVMSDAGMFDRIIRVLLKCTGGSVVGVAVMSAVVAMISHLDGGGASSFLITVPAMLPVYKQMRMRPAVLMLICVVAMGVMNILPWAGHTTRAASVLSGMGTSIDAGDLWHQMMPLQISGIVFALLTAVFCGLVEKKRGAGRSLTELGERVEVEANELARPQNFWLNVVLTLAVVYCLVFVKLPSYYTFMVGAVAALFINYPGSAAQTARIKDHADTALVMSSTILCAGVFLGLLSSPVAALGKDQFGKGISIMSLMARMLASLVPAHLGRFLPLFAGAACVPLTILFDTTTFYFALLPVLIGVGNSFGVDPVQTAIVMVMGRNCASFITPVVPTTFIGIGLAGVDINEHLKFCFPWCLGLSFVFLVIAVICGLVTF